MCMCVLKWLCVHLKFHYVLYSSCTLVCSDFPFSFRAVLCSAIVIITNPMFCVACTNVFHCHRFEDVFVRFSHLELFDIYLVSASMYMAFTIEFNQLEFVILPIRCVIKDNVSSYFGFNFTFRRLHKENGVEMRIWNKYCATPNGHLKGIRRSVLLFPVTRRQHWNTIFGSLRNFR